MNTIFWKGVYSNTIEGLLISELPPISKPPLRVKETTIDGRDGSIIDELGYSSYEKSITIGLHGNYNINKVIKYFTGEGEIVFSNEPEKVYNAKIVAKVDYNRLLRYRTAVVKFKVQPYKYKYNEAYKETESVTASGHKITIKEPNGAVVKSFCADTDAVVVCNNKNLFYHEKESQSINGIMYTVNADKSITVSGTAEQRSVFWLITNVDKKTLPDGTYTVSTRATIPYDVNLVTEEYSQTMSYVQRLGGSMSGTNKTSTFSVTDMGYLSVYLVVEKGLTVDFTVYPQLELGSGATEYETAQESTAEFTIETGVVSGELKIYRGTTHISNNAGADMNITYIKNLEVFNEGFEDSKPKMVLHGSGTVGISVNGIHIFDYTFPEGETEVVIDSEKEDAYLGEVLKNRHMNGEFPVLLAGTNKIEWSGDVESIEILPRSRWL